MVQVLSQNGWPAYAVASNFSRFTAAGWRGWAANADVAVIFTELVTRFNAEVEPIAGPLLDDWSWADRLVRDSTSEVSNHGSATAIDLNATQHPRGVHGTFSTPKTAAVRKILADLCDDSGRPILRWGNDYVSAPIDSMHFEINDDPAHTKQAADRIRSIVQEIDMQLDDTIELTAAAARALSGAPGATPRKAGDKISVKWFLIWGGAGLANVQTEAAKQADRLTAIEARLLALESPVSGTVHQLSGTAGSSSGTSNPT
jgi:hypothetical protein